MPQKAPPIGVWLALATVILALGAVVYSAGYRSGHEAVIGDRLAGMREELHTLRAFAQSIGTSADRNCRIELTTLGDVRFLILEHQAPASREDFRRIFRQLAPESCGTPNGNPARGG